MTRPSDPEQESSCYYNRASEVMIAAITCMLCPDRATCAKGQCFLMACWDEDFLRNWKPQQPIDIKSAEIIPFVAHRQLAREAVAA